MLLVSVLLSGYGGWVKIERILTMLRIHVTDKKEGWVKTLAFVPFLDFVRLLRLHRYLYYNRIYFLDLRNIQLPEKASGEKLYVADSNFMSILKTLDKIELNSNLPKTGHHFSRIYDPKMIVKGRQAGVATMEELSKKTGKELSAGFNSLYPHQKKFMEELYEALSEEEIKITLEKALGKSKSSSLHVDNIDDNKVDK